MFPRVTGHEVSGTIAEVARTGCREGQFRKDLDTEQFAWEFHSITLTYQFYNRLIRDPNAEERARKSFNGLIRASRA